MHHHQWQTYISDFHFPIAKTLVNLSFAICVLFAFTQMMATVYPHFYRNHITTFRIKLIIFVSFIYIALWFIPSGWWFGIVAVNNICGLDPNLTVYKRRFIHHAAESHRVGWIVYGFFREFMTKFIPVIVILVFNYFSLRHKKVMLNWKNKQHPLAHIQRITSFDVAQAVIIPRLNDETTTKITKRQGNLSEQDSSVMPSINLQSENYNPSGKPNSSINNNLMITDKGTSINSFSNIMESPSNLLNAKSLHKIKQRKKEYSISVRMLGIMMLEFLIFLFPVSVFIMTVDFYEEMLSSSDSDLAFAACTLMEYLYIALNFYLNMLFNPGYRDDVKKVFRHSKLNNLCKKLKKSRISPQSR
ncbi:unnamed protein product [Gordionus sp. m RMFG-2023]